MEHWGGDVHSESIQNMLLIRVIRVIRGSFRTCLSEVCLVIAIGALHVAPKGASGAAYDHGHTRLLIARR